MRIYNLFPLLAGKFSEWEPHLARASEMGFNWVFINPVQEPGLSGSLYSIKDYFSYNPLLVDPDSSLLPEQQLRESIKQADKLGFSMMIDLVINHTAIDAILVKEHQEWFKKDKKGNVAHPWCMDGKRKVVWGDLASLDHEGTSNPEGLFNYIRKVIDHLIGLGFKGFRCDAAYQLPPELWQRLILETRESHEDIVFAAETLGCTHEQTLETARAGFDYIFNSSKWWDYKSDWLLDQYNETRLVCPSISFPETHDTLRLAEEMNGNLEAMRQRYLFSACFSTAVMLPMGFEFAFRKRQHVVNTRPTDWEETGADLSAYIREVNALKDRLQILNEDSKAEALETGENGVLMLLKHSKTNGSSLLMIINMDPDNPVELLADNPHKLIGTRAPVSDVTPGNYPPVDTSGPLSLTLDPARTIVLYCPSQ